MYLADMIKWLEALPEGTTSKIRLRHPHSFRGYYEDLAFEWSVEPQTKEEMLEVVKGAHGQTFQGWKGGEFKMGDYTAVWLAEEGEHSSDPRTTGMSSIVLSLMFDQDTPVCPNWMRLKPVGSMNLPWKKR